MQRSSASRNMEFEEHLRIYDVLHPMRCQSKCRLDHRRLCHAMSVNRSDQGSTANRHSEFKVILSPSSRSSCDAFDGVDKATPRTMRNGLTKVIRQNDLMSPILSETSPVPVFAVNSLSQGSDPRNTTRESDSPNLASGLSLRPVRLKQFKMT
jgi:hypothetical protein